MITEERLKQIRRRKYAEDRIAYIVHWGVGKVETLHIVYDDELAIAYMYSEDIYETKEQAEWALRTVAQHTQRFDPPMWKEIEDKFCFKFTLNNENYNMEVHKTGNLIVIWNTTKKEEVYTALCKDCNKKNYEKACQIVKDLFNGKK